MVSKELIKKLDNSLNGLSLKRRIEIKNIIIEIKDEALSENILNDKELELLQDILNSTRVINMLDEDEEIKILTNIKDKFFKYKL